MEDWTFTSCSSLSNVIFPEGLVRIGGRAFSGTGLSRVTLPSTLAEVGPYAFSGANLPNVTIPGQVAMLGVNAFSPCIYLERIDVDPFNTFFSGVDGVLFDKSQTHLIQYPNGRAGTYNIPQGVDTIENFAFSTCLFLTLVTVPDTVISIGVDQPFAYCGALTAIEVAPLNPAYCSLDGVLLDAARTRLIQCPGGKTGAYLVPDGIRRIESYAFSGCHLTEVVVPETVDDIGRYAFASSRSLFRVSLPDSVTSLGAYAFYGCSGLTSVRLSSGLTDLQDRLFSGCDSLTYVTVPATVTHIASQAFSYSSNLLSIFFQGNAPALDAGDSWRGVDRLLIYRLPDTLYWGGTFAGHPAIIWNPLLQAAPADPGANLFALTVTGTPNLPFVLEASTNLAGNLWFEVRRGYLIGGLLLFTDPASATDPTRFYRVRSP